MTGQRLDRWLWFARVVKTRTLAARLIVDGKIRINREKADKPSRTVRPGDVITAAVHETVLILRVLGAGVRRGPAPEARLLYEDMTPPPVPSECGGEAHAMRERGAGRPTKRDRRRLDDFLKPG